MRTMCPSLAADGVQLAGRALCLKLTDEAARAWRIRTATYTVKLRLDDQSVERLRHELRRLFGLSGANRPAPKLDL
jgi:hypothetical protein